MAKSKFKVCLPTQHCAEGLLEAGVDEARRGCLAGPVFVGAVILPPDYQNILLQDSKKLTEKQRVLMSVEIKKVALDWAIVPVDWKTIDEINILQATLTGMNKAISMLVVQKPDVIAIDGNQFKYIPEAWDSSFVRYPYDTIVHGDARYANIAAASILAKTARDEWMTEVAKIYPEYGFDKNMGYGTPKHIEAVEKYGLSPIHRKSFKLKNK